MSKNKILAFLMALVVMVNGLPFLASNSDELITVEAAEYGTEYLTGVNLDIYNALRPVISDIAAGNVSSTVVTISLEYTYSELGVRSYFRAKDEISRAIDKDKVTAYLIYDCPYEMYWMDKTVEVTLNDSYSRTTDGITAELTFSYYVATDYQGDNEYTVDEEKIALANAAIENAQAIVDEYADATDSEKLTAYKDEICELVTYEYDYEDADYGDIWQIIWVFDGDDSTNVVCEGYSKAFQYLCDISEFDSDVDCYTVTGYVSVGTSVGAHMWNVVSVDGISYMVDVTNSDEDTLGEDGDMFLICADDAVMSNEFGYIITASGYNVSYSYDMTTRRLYDSDVLTLGSAASSTTTTSDSTTSESIMLGDVNEDGYINYLDAMVVLRYDAGIITLTDDQLSAGDVNGDGTVDSLDAILILRYDAGIITEF